MAILIRIPSSLRKWSDDQSSLSVEARTVGEALSRLIAIHPDLEAHVLSASGDVPGFVNIFLNAEDIRFLHGKETLVQNGDELSIVSAIAGG
jgi:molybdopterin converting factor small subunit